MNEPASPHVAVVSNRPLQGISTKSLVNIGLVGATTLVLAATVALYTLNITVPRVDGLDEGVYLMAARLLRLGYAPNTLVWDQPPLFVILLSWAMRAGGDSIVTARLAMVGFAIVALLALARLPRAWNACYAIPFVLALTATDEYFLTYARTVYGEVPCLAFLMLSLAALLEYGETDRRGWLAAAGVLFALALAIKPTAVGYSVMLGLILVLDAGRPSTRAPRTRRRRMGDLIWFGASALLVLVPALQLYDPQLFLRNEIGFHLAENLTRYGDPKGDWRGLVLALQRNAPLSVLALPGIWAAFQRNALLTLAVGAGMVATVAVLFLLPPFLHHYTLLMPFLALFGGIGIWHAIELIANATRGASGRAHQQRFGWEWLYLGVFGCAAIVAASQSFTLAQRDLEVMMLDTPSALERVAFVRGEIEPDEFVLSDSPMVAFLAGAVLPPCGILLAYPHDWNQIPDNQAQLENCLKSFPIAAVLDTGEYRREPDLWDLLRARFPIRKEGPGIGFYTQS